MNVDRTGRTAVGSTHNSIAPRGPIARRQAGLGPLCVMATVIRCQAPDPTGQSPIHGVRLATVPYAAEPTDVLLSDLRYVRSGEFGAWCPRCKRVTVYRRSTDQEAA